MPPNVRPDVLLETADCADVVLPLKEQGEDKIRCAVLGCGMMVRSSKP